jgi:hypothetical protein
MHMEPVPDGCLHPPTMASICPTPMAGY